VNCYVPASSSHSSSLTTSFEHSQCGADQFGLVCIYVYECVDPTNALAEVSGGISRWRGRLSQPRPVQSDKSLVGSWAAQPAPKPGHEEVTPQVSTTLVRYAPRQVEASIALSPPAEAGADCGDPPDEIDGESEAFLTDRVDCSRAVRDQHAMTDEGAHESQGRAVVL
jgi:hypothetical protein